MTSLRSAIGFIAMYSRTSLATSAQCLTSGRPREVGLTFFALLFQNWCQLDIVRTLRKWGLEHLQDSVGLALSTGKRFRSRLCAATLTRCSASGRQDSPPHRPVQTGFLFSPNAFSPSLASSVIASSAIWLSV